MGLCKILFQLSNFALKSLGLLRGVFSQNLEFILDFEELCFEVFLHFILFILQVSDLIVLFFEQLLILGNHLLYLCAVGLTTRGNSDWSWSRFLSFCSFKLLLKLLDLLLKLFVFVFLSLA